MNAKVGNAQHRPLQVYQPRLHTFPVLRPDQDPSRYGQVSVEPSVPDPSTVSLHIQLSSASCSLGPLGVRLDPDVGRVGVPSDYLEPAGRRRRVGAADGEGDEGGGVARVEVLAGGFEGARPRYGLGDFNEAFGEVARLGGVAAEVVCGGEGVVGREGRL